MNGYLIKIDNEHLWDMALPRGNNCTAVYSILNEFLCSDLTIAEVLIDEIYQVELSTSKFTRFKNSFLSWCSNCYYSHRFKELGLRDVEMRCIGKRVFIKKIPI